MNEFPNVLPLLDGFAEDGELPKKEGSCSFPAIQKESGKKFMVTRISVPEIATNADALVLAGVIKDRVNADDYYKEEVAAYKKELASFAILSKHDNVCGFLRYQVVPKETQAGYDIYILSKRRPTLSSFMKEGSLNFRSAIELGLNLCNSLVAFRKEGFVHQNITPKSVFWDNGSFSVGSLGIQSIEGLEEHSIAPKYISPFTAPELCKNGGKLNLSADIYSVGMILYTVFNGNQLPFSSEESSQRAANKRRISGEELPAPLYADYELDQIIRKACAFSPEDRFRGPAELQAALSSYLESSANLDQPIIPPIVSDRETAPIIKEIEEEPIFIPKAEPLTDDFKETFTPHDDAFQKKNRKKRKWPFILLLIIVLLGAAFTYYRYYYSAVTISSIDVIERGLDYLTVQVESNNQDGYTIRCYSEDGSYSEIFRGNSVQTFSHLAPNTVYHFTIAPLNNAYLKGISDFSTATLGTTDISEFSMTVLEDGTASLSMQVSGPEPDIWELISFRNGVKDQSYEVINHSCVTSELLPNEEYSFLLNPGPDYSLSGVNAATAVRTVEIKGLNLEASYDSSSKTISAKWDSDLDYRTLWTVSLSGSNGYFKTLETEEKSCTFENIVGNSEYTVNVSNASPSVPLVSTLKVPAGTISSFKAEENEDGIHVSWDYDGNFEIESWKISLISDELDFQTDFETDGTEFTITDYLPDAEYRIALDTVVVTLLDGEMETKIHTDKAEAFSDKSDHKLGGTYTAFYERPSEKWTIANLSKTRNSFAVNTPFVMLVQAINIPRDTDEPEKITVLLVIRDENGKLKYARSYDSNWNDVWDVNLFADEMVTPIDSGNYKAEIYFNRYLLSSSPLTVTD